MPFLNLLPLKGVFKNYWNMEKLWTIKNTLERLSACFHIEKKSLCGKSVETTYWTLHSYHSLWRHTSDFCDHSPDVNPMVCACSLFLALVKGLLNSLRFPPQSWYLITRNAELSSQRDFYPDISHEESKRCLVDLIVNCLQKLQEGESLVICLCKTRAASGMAPWIAPINYFSLISAFDT